ncbi:MAG TPA: tetratricopeptide repeat protein [Vicinamibacteria bacterium]|nr:tetratricopeptide repeat protein [Vicinamibacteria bacterium]
MRKLAPFVAGIAACLAASAARAAQDFASARLDNGVSVGFALLRSGPADPRAAIGDTALARSNGVSRILWDRETGAYFGYEVEVRRQRSSRPFRVTVRPLDPAFEGSVRERVSCAGCPPPAPLTVSPARYPAPQQLAEGDSLTLELLANPTTGERILDVVKVSARPLDPDVMKVSAQRALVSWEAVRRANDDVAHGSYRSALTGFLRALPLQRNDPVIHNKLGICYQNLGERVSAQAAYAKALQLDGGYAEAWNNLGTLHQMEQRFGKAVESYRKAISLKPGVANFWKNLGSGYLSQGRESEALEAYREAFRLDPTILGRQPVAVDASGVDAASHSYLMAKVLAAGGQRDAALAYLQRARDAGFRDFAKVESDPDFRSLLTDPRFAALRR